MASWLKAELHVHTAEDPEDGGKMVVHRAEVLIDQAAAAGIEVLSITNHNQFLYHRELIAHAQSRGVLLIPGVEGTIEGRHILLYNFLDYQPSWQTIERVRRSKGPQQMVIAPHPFYPVSSALRGKFFEWIDLFDAVELNAITTRVPDFNRRARREAKRAGLPLVASNDLHFLFQLGRSYSMIFAEPNVASVIQAVKTGAVRPVAAPGGVLFLARWFAALFRNRAAYSFNGRSL